MTDEPALEPAPGLRVVWDAEAVSAYTSGEGPPQPAWRLEGSIEPGPSALRVLSAAMGDGSLLLLAAARPSGSEAHDSETVAALVTDPDGVPGELADALVSTQYAADGSIQRLGLELYKPDDDYALRGAGDATSTAASEEGGVRRESAALSFRLDGHDGVALYEILSRI